VVELVGEADHGEELAPARLSLVLREAEHGDRRLHAVPQRRHVGEEVEVLEDHADLAAHPPKMPLIGRHQLAVALHAGQRFAVDPDHAAIDRLERHQHAQHGGLARTRRADDRHLFAGGDVEVELVEHDEGAVTLGHLVKANHGHGRVCGRGLVRSGAHQWMIRRFRRASTILISPAAIRLKMRKMAPTMVIGST
jgi:hypothetical protein